MAGILKSRWAWAAGLALLLLGLYAFLGFRIAPGLIRDQAIEAVRSTYGRELQIGEVRVQPFKLQLEVRDLAFPDRDRQPMLSLRRLFVDFELSSLWRRAWVFSELDLDGPAVSAVLRRDGTLNLSELSPPPPAVPPPTPPPSAELPALWIESLVIRDGSAQYTELAGRQQPFVRGFAPIGFTLKDFRTTPEGGAFRLTARSVDDERFDWNGRFALAPKLASRGEFSVAGLRAAGAAEFLGEALPFGVASGAIDVAGRYDLSLGATTALKVEIPKLALASLGLRARGLDADWVTIPSIVVTDTSIALPEQAVAIGAVTIDRLRATAWLGADGSINLEKLFAPGPAVAAPAAVPDAAPAFTPAGPPPAAPERPWALRVASFELRDAGFDVEDRVLEPVKRFRFAPLNLRLRDASLDLAKPLPISLDATINDHALLKVAGTLAPEPLAGELEVSLQKARMQMLQPYVLPVADLTIRSGLLGVTGKLRLASGPQDGPAMRFDGDVTVDGFGSVDNALREDLVSFRQLQLQKVRYAMTPDSLDIDLVRVVAPYARVIISREQILNIAAVLDPRGTAEAAAARRAKAAALAAETRAARRQRLRAEKQRVREARKAARRGRPPVAALAPPPADSGMPIQIRAVRVEAGRMNFSDLSIQPNFSAEVLGLAGSITRLSTAFSSRATIDLKGRVDEFSPVTIAGTVQPFAFDRFTDVALRFENIALPVFNPYSGQFAGFNISKGKLTTDLRYRIDNRKLDAAHKIRIDQLEWGEASATRGEATLPVKFATSLLKDRDGVINLDVPVTGTLDDPKLRIGPIVWQIVKNLIVKAVTAPFALLGSLFAGAEQANFIDFAPGEAALDAATAERLGALAKGLAQKPAVSLDVPVAALAALDLPALAERRFLAQRDAAVAATLRRTATADKPLPAYETLAPGQQLDVLKAMLQAQGGALPKLPEPPPPPPDASRAEARTLSDAAAIAFLTEQARARVPPQDAALTTLARERAAGIQRALLQAGEIEASRVFLVTEGKVSQQDGKVRFELGLK